MIIRRILSMSLFLGLILSVPCNEAWARTVEYDSQEIKVFVKPGEPTQIKFPGLIAGGFKSNKSSIDLDRNEEDLIIFARESLVDTGEVLIVRLKDGRSFSVRVMKSGNTNPRDDVVEIDDVRLLQDNSEEEKPYDEKTFNYAPPNRVNGLIRELILLAEFGKSSIPGYRVSERYRGDKVLDDGTLVAKIDKIMIGPTLWGYVIDVENLLDIPQKLDPASFRIDGTRAISASNWELSPRPLNAEQRLAKGHKSKVYVVTRPIPRK